jgi:hypothetical protein
MHEKLKGLRLSEFGADKCIFGIVEDPCVISTDDCSLPWQCVACSDFAIF